MNGTPNQIELAEQIRSCANDEFDRVAKAFSAVAGKQAGQDRNDTWAIIRILEEKRTEVMAIVQAGYFIRTWRELNDQVRQMIGQDERYLAIKANRMTGRDESGKAWKERKL